MLLPRPTGGLALALVLLAAPSGAQHAGHDVSGPQRDSASLPATHVMAQAIPLLTRADPSAGGVPSTQLALTQLLMMARLEFGQGRAVLNVAAPHYSSPLPP